MNDRNTFLEHDKEWINPSKCLVDKALERWSTTKMRADNTSVVIIMLDPPGPPKREVLRANSSILYDNENSNNASTSSVTIDVQHLPGHNESISVSIATNDNEPVMKRMYDNVIDGGECITMSTTSELDNNIDNHTATVLTENCYDSHQYKPPDYAADGITPNTSGLSSYMNTFAESYNSLLNSNYDVDHHSYASSESSSSSSCSYQSAAAAHHQSQSYLTNDVSHLNVNMNEDNNDTYSLTKLATRTEQEEEGYVAVTACNATFFDEDETRACIFGNTYPQHHTSMDIDDENQYDSITSSHLSAACEVYENLDCSAQANISVDNLQQQPQEHILTSMPDTNEFIFNDENSLSPETVVITPNCDLYTMPIVADETISNQCNLQPDQSIPIAIIPSMITEYDNIDVLSTTEIVATELLQTSSSLDESIQIHEISSSSKENDSKSSSTSIKSCESKENKTIDQQTEFLSTIIPTPLRVTRSTKQQQIIEEIPASTTTRQQQKTKNDRSTQRRYTNIVQNENIIRQSTRRRMTQNDATTTVLPSRTSTTIIVDIIRNSNNQKNHRDMDNSQRTLRSKNVINKIAATGNNKNIVSKSNNNNPPLLVTSKTKFKSLTTTTTSMIATKSKATPKVQAMVAAAAASSLSNDGIVVPVVTRWLREKTKTNVKQQSQQLHQQHQQASSISSTKQKPCLSSSGNVALKASALRRSSSLISATAAVTAGKSNRIKNQQTRRK